jgi:hypothetical protein
MMYIARATQEYHGHTRTIDQHVEWDSFHLYGTLCLLCNEVNGQNYHTLHPMALL